MIDFIHICLNIPYLPVEKIGNTRVLKTVLCLHTG